MNSALVSRAVELFERLDQQGKDIFARELGVSTEARGREVELHVISYSKRGNSVSMLVEDMEADLQL